MNDITANKKLISLTLLTVLLICGVQGVSYSGELFWEVGEAVGAGFGAVGEGLGAAGEGLGDGLGAVGQGLGAAGEGLGAAWETFDAIGEAVGVHPVELIATGGISAILHHIPLPDASVRGHVRGASNVFVIPGGGHIGIVVSGSVYFWDSDAGQFAAPLIHGAPIFRFVVSPDAGMLATTSEGGNVQLWTRDTASADSSWAPTGQQLRMTVAGNTSWAQLKLEPRIHVLSTAFSPDGEILAGGSAHGTVRLWNATTGSIRTTLRGHSDSVTSIAFSPDGRRLATASVDGTVRLWNPDTGDLQTTLGGHTGSVLSVAFNPVNDQLASASLDGTVRLWNPTTEEHEATLDHESPVLDIAFSPDGEVLASANVNGSVRLWDPDTRTVHALLGHGSPVTTVAFGADKHTVITGSRDGQIRQWEVWDVTDKAPEILTASTAVPLTEPTIHENVVTLTLSRLAFARSIFDIRDAVTVSGISGVTIPRHQPDRKSDTEITVQLEFNGNIDKDADLTFAIEANAVPGYFGPTLTAQLPVTAFTESVTASTASPLTEASLDGSVVTLTLDGGTYARSRVDIGRALNVSGVPGVAVDWSEVDRLSDTEIRVELGFNGDIDADATLTFSVGAGAIAGYGGAALTATLPVVASMESVAASTVSPLTERTLNGSVVTLTLNGRDYAKSIFDIRDAVKVSGVDGVTMPWHQPDRKSDTEISVKLEFNGDVDTDATLTFTVGADAIAGYNGAALTVQLPVATFTESVAASTVLPLKEATLEGSIVTLTLSGCTYEQSIWDIQRAVKVSGIAGATVDKLSRVSDSEVSLKLEFNGNIDTDATLTFTVEAKAIKGYNGSALTAQLPVTASTESVVASTASPLTESTLNGSVVTLTLSGRSYARSGSVSVSGIGGVAIKRGGVKRVSGTEVTVELTFSGNLDANATLTVTASAEIIAGYNEALTAQVAVTAVEESLTASTPSPLTEHTLEGSVVTLTLSGRNFESSSWDISRALAIAGIDGLAKDSIRRISDTEVTVELEFNGDIDEDTTLTFTLGTDAIAGYGGSAFTTQLPVTASTESVAASTVLPLKEATLEGSIVTLTLNACTFEQSIRDAVKVSGIAGVEIPWRGLERKSDTEVAVTLEFDGNMNADATLVFSVDADAIAGYSGLALTTQLPVTASAESIAASTPAALTEATLNGNVVTLTLVGRSYAQSIGDGVKVSGIAGVTIPWRGLDRKNDTEITVELEFNGDIDTDSTLTFSVGPDAITGYGGSALTAQLPVTAQTESITASIESPLIESTLNGSAVTLNLNGRGFVESIWDIRRALKLSDITGATVDESNTKRISDTAVAVAIEFNGDIDTDASLTFSVGKDAIANYNGPALTAQLPVTASMESVAASSSPLTEPTLNGSVVTLMLDGRAYAPAWDIRDAVKVSGIAGVTADRFNRISDSEVTVKLEFGGNIDADATLTFSIGADAIEGYNGLALTAQLAVTASTESVAASTASPLTEATLDGSIVTLTLSGCTFARSIFDIRDAVTVAGIDDVTMPWHQPDRKSDAKITIELEFDGDMDADGTLTFTVGADAIANYNGPSLSAQLPVTASKEFALAPNFPNPFNPETWIPYQLASDADVTLTIHASDGQLVRRLRLGYQPAGTYYSRSRAAYWDGKNDFGETVASGVYFYTLAAGDFSATRKMLIRK